MQTSPGSSKQSAPLPNSAAQLIRQKYPTIARYYPHLSTLSAPQAAFLVLDGREAFYGGAAGGGKSDALLMAALQHVDRPGYHALLLRRTFPELEGADGLIAKAHEWFGAYREQGELHWNEAKHRWTFPSGATIQFGHVQDEAAMYRYQGQAYQFVGFDELTHFTERQYEYIAFTRARRVKAHEQAGIPVRARAASNPGNIGHGWVKERFITRPKDGVIFVPAKIADNPGLDRATYEQDLSGLPEELRKQLMEGDWDAFEGAAFTVTADHMVDEFPVRDWMSRFEALDYGLNGAPWAFCPVDHEGNVVFADLLYVKDLLPSQLAPLVHLRRRAVWGQGNTTFADPAIWHRTGTVNKFGKPAVLADEFADHDLPLVKANNDPRAGLIRVREMLKLDENHVFPAWHPRAGQPGAPRVFFVRGRTDRLVDELKSAPLQPIDKTDGLEKVDPEWESRYGHAVAMCRYALMSRPSPNAEPEPWRSIPEHLRPAWVDDNTSELQRELLKKYRARPRDRRTERV